MASRALAGGFLVASGLLAWLTISVTLAARLLQLGIGLSVVYVGVLAWRGHHVMRAALRDDLAPGEPVGAASGRPFVSLVVPARNEASVIEGAVADLAGQTYHEGGAPRYEVLVVDDGSSDGTGEFARQAAGGAAHVRVERREPGSGPATKGAVLAFAMPHLRGEVIGVIDADTRADPDLVQRVMRAWQRHPGAAAIQASRRPRNTTGWLTRAQAEEQTLDLASQCGRWATGGTAELRGNGMFVGRRSLDAVGGWGSEALTEDLDLSTRLAAAGEHVALAPEAVVREEACETLSALWRQRLRWAEGSLRRLMEHGPRLLVGPVELGRKADFLAFTGEFLVPPLAAATLVASLVTILLPRPADWTVPVSLALGYGVGTFLLALAGLRAEGRRGAALVGGAVRGALFLSHWLVVVPAALLRIALWPGRSRFEPTPRSRAR